MGKDLIPVIINGRTPVETKKKKKNTEHMREESA
jgi:hypothetical protein